MEDKSKPSQVDTHNVYYSFRTMPTDLHRPATNPPRHVGKVLRHASRQEVNLEGAYHKQTQTTRSQNKEVALAHRTHFAPLSGEQAAHIQNNIETRLDLQHRAVGLRQ